MNIPPPKLPVYPAVTDCVVAVVPSLADPEAVVSGTEAVPEDVASAAVPFPPDEPLPEPVPIVVIPVYGPTE